MKKILVLILSCALLATAFVGCGRDENTIIIGYDNHFAPMGYVEGAGCSKYDTGFDIDVARAMESYLGKKVKLVAIKWDAKETELKSKNIDLIWNGFTITDERKENVLFSNPYMKNEQVIVIKKSKASEYTDSASLSGKKLVAQKASSAIKAIKENSSLKDNKVVELEENVTVLMELNSGTHDAAIMDSVVANYYLNKTYKNDLVILDEVLADEQYGIGMRKEDTELCKTINAALKKMHEEGKIQEIADKYGLKDMLLADEILKG